MKSNLPKTIFLEVDRKKLADHIKRVCRGNLRHKCKCCSLCPFRNDIIQFSKVAESTKENK